MNVCGPGVQDVHQACLCGQIILGRLAKLRREGMGVDGRREAIWLHLAKLREDETELFEQLDGREVVWRDQSKRAGNAE